MIQDKIIDALNDIDDDMIEETDRLRNPMWHLKKTLKQIGAVAACFAFVAVGVLAVNGIIHDFNGKDKASDSASPIEDGHRIVEVDLDDGDNRDNRGIVIDGLTKTDSKQSTDSDNYFEAEYCLEDNNYFGCLIKNKINYNGNIIDVYNPIMFNESIELYYYNDKHELKKTTFAEAYLEKGSKLKVYYSNLEIEDGYINSIDVNKVVLIEPDQTQGEDY